MKTTTELAALTLTPAEFKSHIIDFIKSQDFKAELLQRILAELPDDKRALFDEYQTNITTEPISQDPSEWERGAYFFRQVHMAETNFCLKRIEHLIEVKSHLTERGIAGFSRPSANPSTHKIDEQGAKVETMNVDFSCVNLEGFSPTRSLSTSVNNDDISSIRNALFMEMNDDHITTSELRQAIAWTLSKHPNLFVAYEENAYSQGIQLDTAKWNSQYYGIQEVYASSNFSQQRILHMLAVREHVFNLVQDKPRSAATPSSRSQNALKQTYQHKGQEPASHVNPRHTTSQPHSKVLNSMVVIGGIVAAIALVFLAVIL